MILGMGIWTIWQVITWALICFLSGMIGKYSTKLPLYIIVSFSYMSSYIYGLLISLTTYQVTVKFLPYYVAGLPFDTYHAVGNAIFMVLLYPFVSYLLRKYANHRFRCQHI